MSKNLLKNSFFAFILLCLYIPGLVFAASIPTISLNLLDTDIHVGDSFGVQVLADGDGIGLGLLSFGFDVNTTGSAFDYNSYSIGSGFDDDSSFVLPDVAGSAFPAIVDNNVLLATLNFTATTVGTGSVQALGLTDFLFFGLAYESAPFTSSWYGNNAALDIMINAAPIATVPLPSSFALFGMGLIGLFGFRRRLIKQI